MPETVPMQEAPLPAEVGNLHEIDQTAFGAIQLEGDYEVAFHARAYLLWVTAVFGLLELGPFSGRQLEARWLAEIATDSALQLLLRHVMEHFSLAPFLYSFHLVARD